MPTFPKYRGNLPECLNPLDPSHYCLLAYWVYFRPTALNCYLYQAAPECKDLRGLSKVRRTWTITAYRNLYLMLPVAVLLFALLVGLVVGLYLLWTLQGHTDWVRSVTVIPNSQQAVSAGADSTLRVWNLKNGKSIRTWKAHTASINAVAVTSDAEQVVSAGADGTLGVWYLKNGESLATLEGHTAPVNAVAVTPDGQQAISASLDGILKVWDLKSGKSLRTLQGHTASINAVAVTPDSQQVVSAGADGTLRVWELKSGKSLRTLQGHTAPVNALAVTPDSQQAISASDDYTLRVWDLKSGKFIRSLQGHTTQVLGVAVTPDSQQAVSAAADGTLRIWDLKSGKSLRTLKGHTYPVRSLAVTSNGEQVISASADGSLRVWNLKSGGAVPLLWAKINVAVLSLATVILLLLAAINVSIVFPIFLAIAASAFGVAGGMLSGLVGSVVFGLGFATATALVVHLVSIGYLFNILGVAALGTVSTTTFAITFSIVFGLLFSVALSSVSRTAFGVLGSAIALALIGVLVAITIGLFNGINLPLESATFNANGGIVLSRVTASQRIKAGLDSGVSIVTAVALFALLALLGSLRIPFYPIQLALALRSQFKSKKHPVEWDELTLLPLPGTRSLVSQRLQHNEAAGLALVTDLTRNPFRRSAAQKTLKSYLYAQAGPLHLLYKLLTLPGLNAYAYTPVSPKDWEQLPTTGHLLLGELSGQWVNCSTGRASQFSERLVWYLTWLERDLRKTSLTRFSWMLYKLLDEKAVNAEGFDLAIARPIYARLTNCPGGVEIERSFDAIASFLSYNELSALPAAVDAVAGLPPEETAIRPTVLKALNGLRDIGSEVATYLAATTRVNKLAAISRATDALKTLDEYITAEVVPPEQTLLRRIIRQWSKLIIEESGKVGRVEVLKLVANPYIVGNPVTGDLFVGREDVLRRLEELWMVTEHSPSVVLYGHHCMGKSSILRNLRTSLGSQITVVDFNMQRIDLVANIGEFLYNFTLEMYDCLSPAQQAKLAEPTEKPFLTRNPYTAFNRFLKRLDRVRAEQRFIVTIDDFELIEQVIQEQRLEPRLLEFWRDLIQTYPWFVMALAGRHTLQEMTQDYWNPLFERVIEIPVSFLSPKSAERLIRQPSPNFNLDYEADAVAEIIKLTNGQPYLVQLIGHTLVTRFNRQTFEEGIERERRFTIADVEAVINAPEFYQDGHAYFNGIWVQAQTSEPQEQTVILEALSQAGLSIREIANKTALSLEQVQAALGTLQRHDVLKQQDGRYLYTVELMRRWVAQRTGKQQ